jgi:hypothetical protein
MKMVLEKPFSWDDNNMTTMRTLLLLLPLAGNLYKNNQLNWDYAMGN